MSDNKLFSEQVAENIKRQGSDRQLVALSRKWVEKNMPYLNKGK